MFKKKIYLTGGTGAGKSVLIGSTLSTCKTYKKIDSICFAFSAQTKAISISSTLESKLNQIKKKELGAFSGRSFVVFIDDINMPAVEEYGA